MRMFDRVLAVLLMLGAVGHTLGSVGFYAGQPVALLWALCASLCIVLIGCMNLLRTWRPGDRALAWLAIAGALAWMVVSVVFGVLIGRIFDPRVVLFVLICTGLITMGLKDAMRPPAAAA
jgi:hypothetical protein